MAEKNKNIQNKPKDKGFFHCVMKAGSSKGTKIEEKQCNWASIPLDEIEELHCVCCGKDYVIKRSECNDFVEFIQYKTAILSFQLPDRCIERVIGWHDGTKEYLLRIKEADGSLIEEVVRPLKGHLHPQSNMLIKG